MHCDVSGPWVVSHAAMPVTSSIPQCRRLFPPRDQRRPRPAAQSTCPPKKTPESGCWVTHAHGGPYPSRTPFHIYGPCSILYIFNKSIHEYYVRYVRGFVFTRGDQLPAVTEKLMASSGSGPQMHSCSTPSPSTWKYSSTVAFHVQRLCIRPAAVAACMYV